MLFIRTCKVESEQTFAIEGRTFVLGGGCCGSTTTVYGNVCENDGDRVVGFHFA